MRGKLKSEPSHHESNGAAGLSGTFPRKKPTTLRSIVLQLLALQR